MSFRFVVAHVAPDVWAVVDSQSPHGSPLPDGIVFRTRDQGLAHKHAALLETR